MTHYIDIRIEFDYFDEWGGFALTTPRSIQVIGSSKTVEESNWLGSDIEDWDRYPEFYQTIIDALDNPNDETIHII